jgi:hypothetical protein
MLANWVAYYCRSGFVLTLLYKKMQRYGSKWFCSDIQMIQRYGSKWFCSDYQKDTRYGRKWFCSDCDFTEY